MDLNIAKVEWLPSYRIIPSKFPPINLFSRIADPDDLDALYELENLTNERLRNEHGEVSLVPRRDCLPDLAGNRFIMATFTHIDPCGSRFSDGSFGVFYCAHQLDTAIAETKYHRTRFLHATQEAPGELDMRVLLTDLSGPLHDIRAKKSLFPEIYDAHDYKDSQNLALNLKKQNVPGVTYDSVRDLQGQCAAVFHPPLLSRCRQERHLCYVWDGHEIVQIYEKKDYARLHRDIETHHF